MSQCKNIILERFDSLIAVEQSGFNERRGEVWTCICDCGEWVDYYKKDLLRGHSKSCGCKRRGDTQRVLMRVFFYNHKQTAKRRGLVSFLTREQYETIVKTPCFWCGGFSERFENNRYGISRRMLCNTADRLNKERFYSVENTVSACVPCQYSQRAEKEHRCQPTV